MISLRIVRVQGSYSIRQQVYSPVSERLGKNVGFEENALWRKTDLKFQGEGGWGLGGAVWGVSGNFWEISEE